MGSSLNYLCQQGNLHTYLLNRNLVLKSFYTWLFPKSKLCSWAWPAWAWPPWAFILGYSQKVSFKVGRGLQAAWAWPAWAWPTWAWSFFQKSNYLVTLHCYKWTSHD
jgi:hypothetical protein